MHQVVNGHQFANRALRIALCIVGIFASALPSARAACVAVPSGIVGWWAGETNGADWVGTNVGILEGSMAFSAGEVRQAFKLNGVDTAIRVPISPSLNVGLGAGFTIEMWINPTNVLQEHPLAEWNSGSFGVNFHLSTPPAGSGTGPGCLTIDVKSVNNQDHTLSTDPNLIQTDVFQHVAATYDKASGLTTLYINGVGVAQANLGSIDAKTSGDLYFGLRPFDNGAGQRFAGMMDEISVYNRELSAGEIESIYLAGVDGKCPPAPSIVTQPTSQTVGSGNTVTFSVSALGPAPFSYQWHFEGNDISWATNYSLVLSNVQVSDTGNYSVTVQNAYAPSLSDNAYLSVYQVYCVPPVGGIAGWWQGEGNLVDVTGTDTASLVGGATYGIGKVGREFVLNGSTGYISLPASTNLDLGAGGSFTFEGWINPTNTTLEHPLLEWYNGGNFFGVHFWISQSIPVGNGPGCLYANLRDTSGFDHILVSASGYVVPNDFQHVALTYDHDTGTTRLYYNGTVVAQTNLGIFTAQTTYPLYFGARPGYATFPGGLDELTLYSRALSMGEISAIFQADTAGKCGSAPFIVSQPGSQTIGIGNSLVFSASVAGFQPSRSQWRFNNADLPGATNSTLTFVSVQAGDAGTYSIVATNDYGVALGSNFVLTVFVPSCVTTQSGMASWWQGEGNTLDETTLNPLTFQGVTGYAPGKVGRAFSFDGTIAYLSATPSASLNVGTNGTGLTVDCWLKPSDLENRPIFEWNNNGAFGVHVWISQPVPYGTGSGCIYANVRSASGADHLLTSSPGVVSSNSFQHVALTYDPATGLGRLYCNGAIVAEQNLGVFVPQTSYPFFLGARPSGAPAARYAGLMDEVTLYRRALSPAEIQAVVTADTSGLCPVAPSFLIQPSNQVVTLGNNAILSAQAAGSQPLTYQWQLSNTNLPGATNPVLIIYNISNQWAGSYSVIASNSVSSVVSTNVLLTIVPASCSSYPTGLVSWWTGQGDAVDHVGTNNGTAQGAMTFVPGKVENCFGMNGVDAGVAIPSSATLNVGTGNGFTIDLWVNPADLTDRPLVEWNASGIQAFMRLSTTAGSVGGPGCVYANIMSTSSADNIIATPAGVLVSNVFQHVALTYNKLTGIAAIYVNGALAVQKSLGVFIPRTTGSLYFGTRPAGVGSGVRFSGQMDEVDLFSRALTTAEVQAIYNTSYAGKCKGPSIVSQPQTVTVLPTNNASFAVSAIGFRPLSYQWQFNNAPLAAATNSFLTITNVQITNAGSYSVIVTNAFGLVASTQALLKVRVVFVFGDGLPLTNAAYTFPDAVTIKLQNYYTNGGFMFYTLDGSMPTFSSPSYVAPFVVTQTSTLRVLAVAPDFQSLQTDPISLAIVPGVHLSATTAGGGTIAVSPTNSVFISNSVVTVTATPLSGWRFLQWQGDLSGTNPSSSILLNGDKSVRAVFGTALATSVTGPGTILLNPAGGIYPYGTMVQASAVPQAGNFLVTWGGLGSGHDNPLLLTLTNANQTISALIGAYGGGLVALSVIPTGHGTVSLSPASNFYTAGQQVTVTATPETNHTFLGWSGDASGTQNPLVVTLATSKIIYANFNTDNRLVLSLSPGGSSAGVTVDLVGEMGSVYQLNSSSNLVNWLPLYTTTNSVGTIHYIDSSTTNLNLRFYQGLRLP